MVGSAVAMTYHILVVGEGRPFGLSTANVYVNLAGEYHCTGRRNLMRGDSNLLLTVSPFGPGGVACDQLLCCSVPELGPADLHGSRP